MKRILLPLLLSTSFILPVYAQVADDRGVVERMDRLERDLNTVQKQMGRKGSSVGTNDAIPGYNGGGGGGDLEVRVSAMEEEMRKLRGTAEENAFQLKRQAETLERLQKDNDFRFQQIEKNGAAPAPAAAPAATPAAPATEPKAEEKPAAKGAAAPEFEQPRDHYNYAFRLLNQTRYDDAAKYFKSFTENYPKDPLVGNAYYWLGETYYIKRDYPKAADNFRQGFEALPGGPKAPDNLLKLAMSLEAMKRTKDACTVLEQVKAKYNDSAKSIAQKASQEGNRMGCK